MHHLALCTEGRVRPVQTQARPSVLRTRLSVEGRSLWPLLAQNLLRLPLGEAN